MDEVLQFLEPLAQVVKEMEGVKYPTLCAVLPLFIQLTDHVMDWVEKDYEDKHSETKEAAKAARNVLVDYYRRTTPTNLIPIVLGPGLKNGVFQVKSLVKSCSRHYYAPNVSLESLFLTF